MQWKFDAPYFNITKISNILRFPDSRYCCRSNPIRNLYWPDFNRCRFNDQVSLNLESETWRTSLHLSVHGHRVCSFSVWRWNMVVAVSDWLHMKVVVWPCFCFLCSTSDRPWTTLTSAPCPKPKVSLQLSSLMTI